MKKDVQTNMKGNTGDPKREIAAPSTAENALITKDVGYSSPDHDGSWPGFVMKTPEGKFMHP